MRAWALLGLWSLLLTGCGSPQVSDPLLAAASKVVISPTAANHPETMYLAGVVPSRLASGVHDDLLASALMLQQGDEQLVLVSLDLTGFTRSRGREIQQRLAGEGFELEHVLIASTHTHEAPDTLGVYGPDMLTSGVSPTYVAFVQDSVVELVRSLPKNLTPVRMRAAKAPIDDPGSNFPSLIADSRHPHVTVPYLSAAVFEDEQGQTVASLVNWHSHPEVMLNQTQVSSDFPTWLRQAMQAELGGTCVYMTGAVGGLSNPHGVSVPARDETGQAVLDGAGAQTYLLEASWDKTRSLGFVIAEYALAALETSPPVESPQLRVRVENLFVPIDNLTMQLAFGAGLVEYEEADLLRTQPEQCGSFGCASERVALVRLGPLGLLSSPGETFPETMIGRPGSSMDFGGQWGVHEFAAMDGLNDLLGAAVPMHMGLCGDEMSYLLPAADAHPSGHPEFYEEDLIFGSQAEAVYRAGVQALLEAAY